jgi:cysteinyl-tRNA synthetase
MKECLYLFDTTLRDELARMSIVVKDNKDGTTTWEIAR